MTEINGNYFKNKIGNWQKIIKSNRVSPAWSGGNSTKPKIMKKKDPVLCAYCNKLKIAIAFHPTNKKTKFCSVEHGKLYMVTHPDTRYTKSLKERKIEEYEDEI